MCAAVISTDIRLINVSIGLLITTTPHKSDFFSVGLAYVVKQSTCNGLSADI